MLLVLSTFPDVEKARLVGRQLVTEKLAACVSLLPKTESFFMWEGAMQTSSEVLALIKTTEAVYAGLEARLNELHPYDVPEILALPVSSGLAAYVNWVEATLVQPTPLIEKPADSSLPVDPGSHPASLGDQ